MHKAANAAMSLGAPALDKAYQAEDDYRTLERADEVTRDPVRHKAAKRHAKRKMAQSRRIAGCR